MPLRLLRLTALDLGQHLLRHSLQEDMLRHRRVHTTCLRRLLSHLSRSHQLRLVSFDTQVSPQNAWLEVG
jgi:hypothetical protein